MTWPYSLIWFSLLLIGTFAFTWIRSASLRRFIVRAKLLFTTRLLMAIVLSLLVTSGAIAAWYFGRPQLAPHKRNLFNGVTYEIQTRKEPRAAVIHIVTIDLRTSGISFLVTPGKAGEKYPLTARTTSEFAREFHAQLAINGDFYSPWASRTPWDYYPHSGDPVTVHGFTSSRGNVYTEGERKWDAPTLYLSAKNKPSLKRPADQIFNAISGNLFLVREGKADVHPRPDSNLPEPRTAIGFDASGSKLILILVDGRQPNYSEGLDVDELAALFVQQGAWAAINLDGGGSTTLVSETKPGHWEVLNSPTHTRIPGRERPVGNHLGVLLENKK